VSKGKNSQRKGSFGERLKASRDLLLSVGRRLSGRLPKRQSDRGREADFVIERLAELSAFRLTLSSNIPIVNVDGPTATQTLHPHPADCPGISEVWFQEKVVQNEGRTGGYYAIGDEESARNRWPGMRRCQRCA